MAQMVLIGLTLAVAIVGILWKDPPTPVKVFLIFLVLGSSAASIYKSREDDQDKKFLELALTSTLVPSNSEYTRFYNGFNAAAATSGYDVNVDYPCHHSGVLSMSPRKRTSPGGPLRPAPRRSST
jgi:hypothetical protein